MFPETLSLFVPKAAADLERIPDASQLHYRETVDQTCRLVAPLLQANHVTARNFAERVLQAAGVIRQDVQSGERTQLQVAALTPRQIRWAKEYMRSNLSRKLTVKEIASACHLSVSHFSRGFRLGSGITPHRWLLKRRVEHAKWLLLHSHLTIPEITLECGFTHRVAFSKAFSRLIGIGPSSWRREHQRLKFAPLKP